MNSTWRVLSQCTRSMVLVFAILAVSSSTGMAQSSERAHASSCGLATLQFPSEFGEPVSQPLPASNGVAGLSFVAITSSAQAMFMAIPPSGDRAFSQEQLRALIDDVARSSGYSVTSSTVLEDPLPGYSAQLFAQSPPHGLPQRGVSRVYWSGCEFFLLFAFVPADGSMDAVAFAFLDSLQFSPTGEAVSLAPTLTRGTIRIEDATIGPAQSNGEPWDGVGANAVPDEYRRQALTASYAAAVDLVRSAGMAQFGPPDVAGTAELYNNGVLVGSLELPLYYRDSYTPSWGGVTSWTGVEIAPTMTIRITLSDQDLTYNDPIGTVVIDGAELQAAANAGGVVYQVPVSDQTNGQILFIGISVLAE